MRDFIAERLDKMGSSEDKALLKEVLNDVLLPMYNEIERKYLALEQRVRDELPLVYDAYTVYSTVLPRHAIDRHHAYLSPMIPAETEEKRLNLKELAEQIRGGANPVIETVFIEADYLKRRQIDRDRRTLDGAFITGTERCPFKFRLRPAERYLKKPEELYNAFVRNDVPWTTVNGAYLGMFFDVCLVNLSPSVTEKAQILTGQAELDFGPYAADVRRGLIPVWNVDICQVKGEDFPMPALDNVNYEYRFDVTKLGRDNGFLLDCDNSYILDSRREGDFIVITSPQKKSLIWNMYRLRWRSDSVIDSYPYPVLSNARKDSFSARVMAKYGTRIATKAEMRKLMSSFTAAEYTELENFRFTGEHISGDSYDMNPFIRDEIRDPAYQKTLALVFRAKNRGLFLNRDVISFLVSELQAVYPEYRCVGTLL